MASRTTEPGGRIGVIRDTRLPSLRFWWTAGMKPLATVGTVGADYEVELTAGTADLFIAGGSRADLPKISTAIQLLMETTC